ncbi:MAG: hypothetical protein N3G78_01490 [Desulfobacterota bacterium]|nr:hypothetical protein [Thermodesulfobacteriota bacterium]
MANVLGVLIGGVVVIIGIILLVTWWSMFVKGLMATVPALLILIGAGVLLYFISEIKSQRDLKKEEAKTSETAKTE